VSRYLSSLFSAITFFSRLYFESKTVCPYSVLYLLPLAGTVKKFLILHPIHFIVYLFFLFSWHKAFYLPCVFVSIFYLVQFMNLVSIRVSIFSTSAYPPRFIHSYVCTVFFTAYSGALWLCDCNSDPYIPAAVGGALSVRGRGGWGRGLRRFFIEEVLNSYG
jgi:hypothetical protein